MVQFFIVYNIIFILIIRWWLFWKFGLTRFLAIEFLVLGAILGIIVKILLLDRLWKYDVKKASRINIILDLRQFSE